MVARIFRFSDFPTFTVSAQVALSQPLTTMIGDWQPITQRWRSSSTPACGPSERSSVTQSKTVSRASCAASSYVAAPAGRGADPPVDHAMEAVVIDDEKAWRALPGVRGSQAVLMNFER
jgi:hypothetical protein